ncbi:uncharacterized protein [Watersipora subatra]|uniref:uncharacterized protein n=1 Tax=Watersipora subatra TaxID=2589382 RepID=UPI00355B08C1
MYFMKSSRILLAELILVAVILLSWCCLAIGQTTPSQQFEPLKRSEMLRAQSLLRWLINNRTENNTKTFNAGFIRLAFHDCVGGCDGCLNLRNPSNAGLSFYKEPLDLMYREFIFPKMSRADWYALAGLTAVEYAAALTPCTGRICIPPMTFKWGRRDCLNESLLFRQFPGPNNDPRDTIRRTFRMNLLEITALMGAHTLGKNHGTGATWVKNETRFDNQYYKDMIDSSLQWRKGVRQGSASNTWSHGTTGNNLMLDSDFFMAFDVGTNFRDCNNNPIESCVKSETFASVERMAGDNDYWLRHFGTAFTVMLNNGNFGKLKDVEWDTFDDTYNGDIFANRNASESTTVAATTTPATSSRVTTTPATSPRVTSTPGTTPRVTSTPGTTPRVTSTPGNSPKVTTTPSTTTGASAPATDTGTTTTPTRTTIPSTDTFTVEASSPPKMSVNTSSVSASIVTTTSNIIASSLMSASSDLSTQPSASSARAITPIMNNGASPVAEHNRTDVGISTNSAVAVEISMMSTHPSGNDVSNNNLPSSFSHLTTTRTLESLLSNIPTNIDVTSIVPLTTVAQNITDHSNATLTSLTTLNEKSDLSIANSGSMSTTKQLLQASSLAPPAPVSTMANGNTADSRIGYQFENESFNAGMRDRLQNARQRLRSRTSRSGH